VLVAKTESIIDVKADGEERPRRYVPEWKDGSPAQGGGFDKEMLKIIKELKVGSRVRLEWKFDERPRVVKVEVLKPPAEKGKYLFSASKRLYRYTAQVEWMKFLEN
jgi:hypothetical protein